MATKRFQRGKYIGSCRLGDTFSFSFDLKNDVDHIRQASSAGQEADAAWWGESGAGTPFDVSNFRFEVINNAPPHNVIIPMTDGVFTEPETDFDGVLFASFTTEEATVFPEQFEVGQYTIKIQIGTGTTDDDEDTFVTYMFGVDHPSHEQSTSIQFQRMDWIRHDIENVVFPRLKRILGFEGENLLLDLFSYDNAGNITKMRARIFDTAANCSDATPDLDGTDTPEPGELWTYTINQAHNLPRNTRTEHKSVIDFNGPLQNVQEMTVTDNFKETDIVTAPRNDGSWPS